jgi:type II secretory pathway component GspD/PulD (secretin)
MRKGTFSTLLVAVFLTGILCPFAYAQEVSTNIKTLLSGQGKVLYADGPNSIIVIDYPENIQQVAEYLERLDVPSPQVLIEARVVEVKLQKEHSLGVNWNAFTDKGYMTLGRFKVGSSALGTMPGRLEQVIAYKPTFYPPLQSTTGQESPFTLGIFDDNINVVVKALASSLDTNILSAPRITTVNNREAEIKIIQSLPWAEPSVQVSGTSGSVTVTWKINFPMSIF